MLEDIVIYPSKVLRMKCDPVVHIGDSTLKIVEGLQEVLLRARGAGLAAPQIGVTQRIIALNSGDPHEGRDQPRLMVMINPRIVSHSDETAVYREGCLSIPGGYAQVARPAKAVVEYVDTEGNPWQLEVDAERNPLFSACVQHEIDHLDGRLFIDHISRLKRNLVEKSFRKEMASLRALEQRAAISRSTRPDQT